MSMVISTSRKFPVSYGLQLTIGHEDFIILLLHLV